MSIVLLTTFFISFFQNITVHAMNSSSTSTSTFTIEGLGNSKLLNQAVGLPDDKTAVLLRDSNYSSGKQYLRIFDKKGTKVTDVEVTSLMTTKTLGSEDYHIYGLDNGNVVIAYNLSSTLPNSNYNAFFIVVDQNGDRVVNETQINTFTGESINRNVSITQLSNGNIAFAWQRGDNGSYGARVFTKKGEVVTSEIFVGTYNGAQISIDASSQGTFMVAYSYNIYNNGYPTFYDDFKLYNNDGSFVKAGNIFTTSNNGPQTTAYVNTLSNGNYLYSYNDSDSTHYSRPKGCIINPVTGTTISNNSYFAGYGPGSSAVVKTSGEEGFAVTSYDAAYLNAMNTTQNWTSPVNLNINYYNNSGTSQFTKSIDSGYACFKDYDNDMDSETWGMYKTSIGPSFYICSGYSRGLIEIKTDYSTDGSKYTISANLFDIPTVLNSSLSTNSANFDRNTANQNDLGVDLTLNTNTFSSITNGAYTLNEGTDYTITGTAVTINKSYLATLGVGSKTLTFNFSAGSSQNLVVSVTDTTNYSVTFKDYDGTQIGTTQTVTYGHSATAPTSPTRTGYTFTGWDNEFASVTGNLIVTAQYSINHYSVIFKDYNGTQIGTTQTVNYGQPATAPTSPTRTGYTFTGWDNTFASVTGNLVVTAQYSINHYSVTFKDYDGAQIGTTQTVTYGQPATAPTSPTRTGYTFTGWDKAFASVAGDLVVTAQYSINQYSVIFKDYDGTQIGTTQTVNYGQPATAPTSPTRTGYTFTGWDNTFASVTGNLVVTAQYSINHYSVIFKDYDGTQIGTTQTVTYGQPATAPTSPTRTGYTFTGWDKAFASVAGDLIVTAQYSINQYSVTFKDYDGTQIGSTQTVNYGQPATAPTSPTRTGYTFTGWDKIFINVTGDLVVTAQYSLNHYSVIFKDYDGSTIGAPLVVNYGGHATAPLNPTRVGYTFTSWDKDFDNVTGDLVVTAQYSINHYSVTFKDYDGTQIGTTQTVNYGQPATAPANPTSTRVGYTFTGWDNAFDSVAGDLIVTAQYSINHYSVTFKDYDGTQIGTTQAVDYGQPATAPTSPTRTGYTFTGWDNAFASVTGNLVVTAQYSINHYSVTFKDYDGTQIGTTQTVTFGQPATAPTSPTRTGYTFAGWDKSFDSVAGDLIVTAQYSINHYSVTFKDYDGTQIGTTQAVNYEEPATAPTSPTRTGYTFTGWDKAFDSVAGDLIVTAQYSINHYSVTFKDYNGTLIGANQTVIYGQPATVPASPTRTGYTFAGWDKAFDSVTGDLIVTAQYTINQYTVIFKDYDGTQIGVSQTVNYGQPALAPANPARKGYVFASWDKDLSNITESLVVTATYTSGITYSIPTNQNTDTATDTTASAGYLQSRDNTIVIGSKVANLSVPASAIDITGVSASDYMKVTEKVVDKNSGVFGLFSNLPSGVEMVGNPISLNIQLFDSNDTLIRDIHQFANNQKVKVTIKLTSDQIKGLDVSKLSMFYFDEPNKKWDELGGTFTASTMEFTFYTPHFTNFAIMQKVSSTATTTTTNSVLPKTGSMLDANVMSVIGIIFIALGVAVLRKKRLN